MAKKGRRNRPRTTPLGRYIFAERDRRGWILEDLKGRSGVPTSTLSDLESGKARLTDRVQGTLLKIADALGVHPNRLLELAQLTRILSFGPVIPPSLEELSELRLWVTLDQRERLEEYLQFLQLQVSLRIQQDEAPK